jgi:hypothetical protein
MAIAMANAKLTKEDSAIHVDVIRTAMAIAKSY